MYCCIWACNNTCFTLSTAQDFRCWQQWNRHLALERVTKGLSIAARPCIVTLWSSRRTVLVETRELRYTFNSAVSWTAVFFLCILDTIRLSTRTSLSDSFLLYRQLLLLDVVRPSWWYANITLDTVALDTPQRLAFLVTNAPARSVPKMSSFELWYVSHYVVCIAIFYVQLCYCSANLTFTLCSYWWNEQSVKTGHQAAQI